jgi:Tfp pilus assembly protein PilO
VKLQSIKFDSLKRPVTLITAGSVIVLALLWWFMWMTPQSANLATVNAKVTGLSAEDQTDLATLAADRQYSSKVGLYAGYLKMFSTAVPEVPDAGGLTTDLATLADSISPSLHITSITDDTTVPGVAPSLLGTIPLSLELNGPRQDCFAFLSDLYDQSKFVRLVTVSNFAPTPLGSATGDILKPSTELYSVAITGSAYYDPAIDPGAPAPGSSTTTTTVPPA